MFQLPKFKSESLISLDNAISIYQSESTIFENLGTVRPHQKKKNQCGNERKILRFEGLIVGHGNVCNSVQFWCFLELLWNNLWNCSLSGSESLER